MAGSPLPRDAAEPSPGRLANVSETHRYTGDP